MRAFVVLELFPNCSWIALEGASGLFLECFGIAIGLPLGCPWIAIGLLSECSRGVLAPLLLPLSSPFSLFGLIFRKCFVLIEDYYALDHGRSGEPIGLIHRLLRGRLRGMSGWSGRSRRICFLIRISARMADGIHRMRTRMTDGMPGVPD